LAEVAEDDWHDSSEKLIELGLWIVFDNLYFKYVQYIKSVMAKVNRMRRNLPNKRHLCPPTRTVIN